jgi:hypothetical protein
MLQASIWFQASTLTLWGMIRPDYRYPYRPTDGRENLDAEREVFRVLRGGTFSNFHRNVWCAFRFRDLLLYRFNLGGCQVVVLPAS